MWRRLLNIPQQLVKDWQENWHSQAIDRALHHNDAAAVERLMQPARPEYGRKWVYGAVGPLHKAVAVWDNETETVREGDLNMLRRLIEEGTDLELRDEYGQTPLLLASSNGLINVVRVLLEAGADIQAENENGENSYQLAMEDDYTELASLLRHYETST